MNLEELKGEAWKFFPHTFAHFASEGYWEPYSYLDYISKQITPAIFKGGGRFIIEAPPRHGKSELISNWVPTWFLELFPYKKVILASYASDYAVEWGRKVKGNLETLQGLKTRLALDSKAAGRFNTQFGGAMFTAGVGGAFTGRGADLFIIDDPIKNWEEAMSERRRETVWNWYKTVATTRLEPGATIIIVLTRWHEDDLAGRLLKDGGFKNIKLPALAKKFDILGRKEGEALCPKRYNRQQLLKIMNDLGTRFSSALYQQEPTPQEGELLKRKFWKRWTPADLPILFDEVIQSWDMTFKDGKKNDFVVGEVWGRKGPDMFLLDQVRGQWSFTKTIAMFAQLSARWPRAYKKLIENKANGPAIESQLKAAISGIKLIEPEGSKIARATAAEPALESGHVWVPHNELLHPWVPGFINEAAGFPFGKYDDQVDTASQAINFLNKKINSNFWKLIQR